MSTAFPDTLRSLHADRPHRLLLTLALAAALLTVWGLWFCLARVAITEVSTAARVEIQGAAAVSATTAGQLLGIHASAGEAVNRGDPLFEVKTADGRLTLRAPAAGQLHEFTNLPLGAAVQPGDRLAVIAPANGLQVLATFPPHLLGQIQTGMPARLRVTGPAQLATRSIPVTVVRVVQNSQDGQVEVVLAVAPDDAARLALEHGRNGTVAIDVEQVTPATLVLRAVGQLTGGQ